jgi:hypothetical protein
MLVPFRVDNGYQQAVQGSFRYRAHKGTPLEVILRED